MVTAISANNAMSYSAFAQGEGQSRGVRFSPNQHVLAGDRYAMLDRLQSFYDCTQHDYKRFDFDGRITNNPRVGTPTMSGAEKPSFYVPLKMRRPSAPYRLGKIVVDSFTNLLFGEQRFPQIRVDGNDADQDFARALVKAAKLSVKMIEARPLGGAMGTVGLSWAFVNGQPRVDVHNAKNLFVHEWEDRTQLIPRHVTEVYLYGRHEWNGKEFQRVLYWYRRDWLPEVDIVFKPVLYQPNVDPIWTPDPDKISEHGDGEAHFIWIQNLPSEEIDGLPDCDGLYDSLDAVDMLFSVVVRGATLNLDPTLVLKMDPEIVRRMGVTKGTDNALTVGKDGDASYLELGGNSIKAGTDLLEFLRRSILEAAQCVVPDPHEIAAQGVSAVALKALFAPMLAKSDIHREQYGAGIERLLNQMIRVARKNMNTRVKDPATGEETMPMLMLPPRIEREPVLDPLTQKPTGEFIIKRFPRLPGKEGGELDLLWPPHFLPTPDDQTKIVTNLVAATGGKSFMSRETAIDLSATLFGIDPAQEQERIANQAHADASAEQAMTPGIGGEVASQDELPAGAIPKKKREPIETIDTAPPTEAKDGSEPKAESVESE